MQYASTLKKGLSFVEIVIVIAIMAVFALAIWPRMLSFLGKAKVKTTEANIRTVKQAINAYYADTGRYPDALTDLMRKPFDETVARKWQGPYIEAQNDEYVPSDGWEHELVYRRLEGGAGRPYDLYSYGPNGEDGAEEERIYA